MAIYHLHDKSGTVAVDYRTSLMNYRTHDASPAESRECLSETTCPSLRQATVEHLYALYPDPEVVLSFWVPLFMNRCND